jgi:hypothetical protein
VSKYLTFPEIQFRSRDTLVAALAELGWTGAMIEEGAALPLVGYHGDVRTETAQLVVRRRYIGSSSNDLGFARGADGAYSPIISEYDMGHLSRRFGGKDARLALKVAYSTCAARTIAAQLKGARGRVTESQRGSVHTLLVTG